MLPLELAEGELPSRADELFRAKLSEVSPDARGLCEVLSIHDERVTLERCRSLVQRMDERALYLALDELVAEHILLVNQGSYGFRQQALRESVLGRIDNARRRSFICRGRSAAPGRRAERGSRMEADSICCTRAKRRAAPTYGRRGARVLAPSGRRERRAGGAGIETAIALYEKQPRSKYRSRACSFR